MRGKQTVNITTLFSLFSPFLALGEKAESLYSSAFPLIYGGLEVPSV